MLQGRVDDLLRQILLTDGGLSSVMSLEVLLMISALVVIALWLEWVQESERRGFWSRGTGVFKGFFYKKAEEDNY